MSKPLTLSSLTLQPFWEKAIEIASPVYPDGGRRSPASFFPPLPTNTGWNSWEGRPGAPERGKRWNSAVTEAPPWLPAAPRSQDLPSQPGPLRLSPSPGDPLQEGGPVSGFDRIKELKELVLKLKQNMHSIFPACLTSPFRRLWIKSSGDTLALQCFSESSEDHGRFPLPHSFPTSTRGQVRPPFLPASLPLSLFFPPPSTWQGP